MAPPRQRRDGSRLLDFHRPRDTSLAPAYVTEETRRCLRNLAAYRPPRPLRRKAPIARSAAVLVALFIGRMGDLYVLLSQRSASLRTYAGDTSLPGGKREDDDSNAEDTARREAFEEIGLSIDKEKVPFLCVLEPFLAGNSILVTPVVVLILDKTLRPVLNQAEVTSIFSHPLKSFLSTETPPAYESVSDEVPYYTYNDMSWTTGDVNRHIRMHRFLTGREAGGIKPVYGLTAAILIRTASIGFGYPSDFDIEAPGQPSMIERIDRAFRDQRNPTQGHVHERKEQVLARRRSTSNTRRKRIEIKSRL